MAEQNFSAHCALTMPQIMPLVSALVQLAPAREGLSRFRASAAFRRGCLPFMLFALPAEVGHGCEGHSAGGAPSSESMPAPVCCGTPSHRRRAGPQHVQRVVERLLRGGVNAGTWWRPGRNRWLPLRGHAAAVEPCRLGAQVGVRARPYSPTPHRPAELCSCSARPYLELDIEDLCSSTSISAMRDAVSIGGAPLHAFAIARRGATMPRSLPPHSRIAHALQQLHFPRLHQPSTARAICAAAVDAFTGAAALSPIGRQELRPLWAEEACASRRRRACWRRVPGSYSKVRAQR